MPNYIREHLPEELSDLPADLIYATHLYAHEFSLSAPCRESQELRDRAIEISSNHWGPSLYGWPTWAVDLARRYHEDWERCRHEGCHGKGTIGLFSRGASLQACVPLLPNLLVRHGLGLLGESAVYRAFFAKFRS